MKIFTLLLTLLVAFAVWVIVTTPSAAPIKGCMRTSIFKVWLCNKNPNYVPLNQISPIMRSVVIASEDSTFYQNDGFDWSDIHKSFDEDMAADRIIRGGSTITQQLAKNVFLNQNRTIIRKIREAILTIQINALLKKNQILEKYLNVIEFGAGIYGIKAAAKYYFNTTPADLDLLQSAYLTYLIPDPRGFSNTFRLKKLTPYAKFKILDLCYLMFRMGKISTDQYELARLEVDLFPWVNLPPMINASASNDQSTVKTSGRQVGENNSQKN